MEKNYKDTQQSKKSLIKKLTTFVHLFEFKDLERERNKRRNRKQLYLGGPSGGKQKSRFRISITPEANSLHGKELHKYIETRVKSFKDKVYDYSSDRKQSWYLMNKVLKHGSNVKSYG